MDDHNDANETIQFWNYDQQGQVKQQIIDSLFSVRLPNWGFEQVFPIATWDYCTSLIYCSTQLYSYFRMFYSTDAFHFVP